MSDNELDLDDATNGVFYFGTQGTTTTITGSFKPELILETYDGINSKRLYRFPKDENEDECFRFAYKDWDDIKCPKCEEEQFIDEIYDAQDHDDDCDFEFDTIELLQAINEKNKECNKWRWSDEPHHKLEAALLDLFEKLPIVKKPYFKELKKQIKKNEDKIKKQVDPNYKTSKELDRMYKKAIKLGEL
jgi:hypothetical protein